eukprot:COSAG02_NODE_1216_length_13843_cov_500.465949_8_plen_437_part_00
MLLGADSAGDEGSGGVDDTGLSKSGVYTAAFMFIRMLPAIALAPCVGAIAERVDKRWGLFFCDVCAATCVGGMLFLSIGLDQGREGLDGQPGVLIWPAFFTLVFLQQCCAAQYDPLRSSLVPQICTGERDLKLATTVDASVWSALMSIGGAIGGVITTKFGITTNFAVDACSYLASALLTLCMRSPMQPDDKKDNGSGTPVEEPSTSSPAPNRRIPYDAPLGARLCDRLCFPEYATASGGEDIQPIGPYLRKNPGLLMMLFAKMTGALTWSVVDIPLPRIKLFRVLTASCQHLHAMMLFHLMITLGLPGHLRGLAELIEVELSALPSFQLRGSWGSSSATLGLVYAATGVGALLGPLVANSCGGEGSIYMGGSERFSQLIMVVGFFIGTAVIHPIAVVLRHVNTRIFHLCAHGSVVRFLPGRVKRMGLHFSILVID